MTTGIVDTTVLIHLARGNVNANQWLASQVDLAVTSTSWLEFVFGAQSKARQVAAIQLLNTFELLFLTHSDQSWAMQQLTKHRLRNGVAINDCLIASISYRLQLPLFTHNVRDMRKVLSAKLVIQPY